MSAESSELRQICPWCQTEIIWDPEIGPEDVCPHCFNDLGDYRSVTIGGGDDDEDEDEVSPAGRFAGGAEFEAESLLVMDDEPEEEYRDAYGEKVQECTDTQLEAPECSNCRELMLFAGTQETAAFTPSSPVPLGKPFLAAPLQLDVYVCPSCFKTDTYLTEDARLAMTRAFKE